MLSKLLRATIVERSGLLVANNLTNKDNTSI